MCYNADNVLAYILKLTTETIFVLFILTKCLDCLLSMLTGIVNLLQPNRPVIRPTDSSRKTLNKLRTLISKVLWLLRAEPIFLFPQRIFVGKLVHKMDQNFKNYELINMKRTYHEITSHTLLSLQHDGVPQHLLTNLFVSVETTKNWEKGR